MTFIPLGESNNTFATSRMDAGIAYKVHVNLIRLLLFISLLIYDKYDVYLRYADTTVLCDPPAHSARDIHCEFALLMFEPVVCLTMHGGSPFSGRANVHRIHQSFA